MKKFESWRGRPSLLAVAVSLPLGTNALSVEPSGLSPRAETSIAPATHRSQAVYASLYDDLKDLLDEIFGDPNPNPAEEDQLPPDEGDGW